MVFQWQMYWTHFISKLHLLISLKSNKHLYLFTSVDFVTNQLPLYSCIPPRKALARIEVNSAGSEHNTSSNNDHYHHGKNRQSISVSSSLALVYRTQMTSKVKGESIFGQWTEASCRFRINVQSHISYTQFWTLAVENYKFSLLLRLCVSHFPGI